MFSKKKIITFILILVFCISLFSISVSAELVEPSVELNGMEINQIYISVTSSSGIETSLPVNLYPALNEDVGYIFVEAVLNGTNLDSNETYTLNTTLLTRTYLENYENYVVGSYCVYLDNRYVTPLESVNSYRAGKKENEVSYSHNQKATVSTSNKWEREGYKYSFDAGVLGVGYDLYSSYIKFKPVDSTRKSLQIYIYNIDFDVISPEEYASNSALDKEKEEAQISGNSASEDVGASIPNYSAGFSDALENFVQAMSTTDTECKLSFPALKIPALEGLFPETVLSEESDIKFSTVISLIPEAIMKVIRAITTIALIVYCFKELYDTISEALTRRKANE